MLAMTLVMIIMAMMIMVSDGDGVVDDGDDDCGDDGGDSDGSDADQDDDGFTVGPLFLRLLFGRPSQDTPRSPQGAPRPPRREPQSLKMLQNIMKICVFLL